MKTNAPHEMTQRLLTTIFKSFGPLEREIHTVCRKFVIDTYFVGRSKKSGRFALHSLSRASERKTPLKAFGVSSVSSLELQSQQNP